MMFGYVRPAKIQISLCIRAVRSESSLGAFWIAKVKVRQTQHLIVSTHISLVGTSHLVQKKLVLHVSVTPMLMLMQKEYARNYLSSFFRNKGDKKYMLCHVYFAHPKSLICRCGPITEF